MKPCFRLVVTGAASGIGLATVRRAQAQGDKVMAADVDGEKLAQLFNQTDVGSVALDVTEERSVAEALDHAVRWFGGEPDALVHSAGRYEVGLTSTMSLLDWEGLISVNATGSFLVAREFGRRLISAGEPGSLVLLSSIAADHGDDAEPASHYVVGKATIGALTRQLAVEWGRHSIRVNCVAPGLIRTPMLRITDDPDRVAAAISTGVPLGRLGEPDDVAAVCTFLTSPDAAYVTGTTITVDGGLTAR